MNTDDRLQDIYELIDSLIVEENYTALDEIIRNIDIFTGAPLALLAYAVLTRSCRDELPHRRMYIRQFIERFPDYKDTD